MKRKHEENISETSETKSKKKRKRSNSIPDKKRKFVQPKIPRSLDEVSSNWKALQTILSKTQGKRKRHFGKKNQTSESKAEIVTPKSSKDIWFDDVNPEDIARGTGVEISSSEKCETEISLVSEQAGNHPTKRLAMDCEMVGIGSDGKDHMLARVSVVNVHGQVVLDSFVLPQEQVRDYRTQVSGVRPQDLINAPDFKEIQKQVSNLLHGRILVGHAIKNDLKVLFLDHPKKDIRDTQKYKPFQRIVKSKLPSLKKLASGILGKNIHTGEHSSVEDARVAMKLYRMHKLQWERSLKQKKKSAKEET